MSRKPNNLYDNCELYTLDQKNFIGYCPKKRMEWYLEKGLATKITDNSIALKFEPKLRGGDTFEEITTRKENECVVCGVTTDLRKFHTIPQEFKTKFPLIYKSHVSNDIVLLCEDHVAEANETTHSLRSALLKAYSVTDANFVDSKKRKLCLEAKNIIKGVTTTERLKTLLGREDEPTTEEINKIADEDYFTPINGNTSASEYIVNRYIEKDKLEELITLWKQNFVETMEPQFLPKSYMKIQKTNS